MSFEKVGVTCDHAGKELKRMVIDFLKVQEVEAIDYGVGYDTEQSVDYPDYSELVANDVSKGEIDAAIAICGTGIGMCITANKFPGIRATSVWDEFSARMSRQHNNSNVLCIGSRTLNPHRAIDIVKIWLETEFSGDRHQMRLDKIKEIEKKTMKIR